MYCFVVLLCVCVFILSPAIHNTFHTPMTRYILFVLIQSTNLTGRMSSVNLLSTMDENCLTYKERVEVSQGCISEEQCVKQGWNLTGDACNQPHLTNAVADVFLLSLILFIGTFTLAMTFRTFRTSRFFPTIVRTTDNNFITIYHLSIADLSVYRLDTFKVTIVH